jgi:hypothetical protein
LLEEAPCPALVLDRSKAGKPICIMQPPPLRRSNQNSFSDAANTSPAKSSPIRERNPSAGQNPKSRYPRAFRG